MRNPKQLSVFILSLMVLLGQSCSSSIESASINENSISSLIDDSITAIDSNNTIPEIVNSNIEIKPLLNANFSPKLHSAYISRDGFDQGYPIITNNGEQLTLRFDWMDEEAEIFDIKFIHCQADWTPSPLQEMEYLDGNSDLYLEEVDNSFNTIYRYYHYKYSFPNEDLKFLRTGNYVALILDEEENVLCSRRFMVYSNSSVINGKIVKAMDPKYQYTDQSLELTLDLNQIKVDNLLSNLKVIGLQNFRWDNTAWQFKPSMIQDQKITFKANNGNHFPGLKEHRYVDIRNFRYLDGRVHQFQANTTNNIVVLADDPIRSFKAYLSEKDLNGRFTINNRDETLDDVTESDYAEVYFTLPYKNEMFEEEAIYILGNFNNYQPSEKFKMLFDKVEQKYHAKLLLKQGYYDYIYGLYNYETKETDYGFIEGNSPETENEYVILVYLRDQFEGYDKLIGFKIIDRSSK